MHDRTHLVVCGEDTSQRLDVLSSVHSGQSYLGVSQETLYQTVAMVDRVLEECCIPVHRVQLLAVTCLLIASKLEEQQPVEVRRSGDSCSQRRGGGYSLLEETSKYK